MSHDDGKVKVVAEMPGLDERDIRLTMEEGCLVLEGEKKAESEEKGEHWTRRERAFGPFRRVVPLPADVIEDKAEARFAKGVLTVTVPRRAEEKPRARTIEVRPA